MIVDRDRENFLGAFLSDHVLVEDPLDFGGLGDRGALAEGFFAVSLLGDDVVTKVDAFVANINRRAGNQFSNFVLTLAAKRANQVARAVVMLGHYCLRGSLGRPSANDYLINQSVFNRLIWRHEVVAIGIFFDLTKILSGMLHYDVVDFLPRVQNFLRVNLEVARLSLHPAERLMQDDSRMRQRVAPALRTRQEHDRGHARRLPKAQ